MKVKNERTTGAIIHSNQLKLPQIAQLLINSGVVVNAADNMGLTPLDYAKKNKREGAEEKEMELILKQEGALTCQEIKQSETRTTTPRFR